MKAIILAGGKGTRLKNFTSDLPKPMVDVDGQPFLQYLLDYLNGCGCRQVVLAVSYKFEVIRDFFGCRYRDMDIEYCIEDTPLGTGGAVKEALARVPDENIFVLNGDTFFPVNLEQMAREHEAKNAVFTMALKKMTGFDRYGGVQVENGRVTRFIEKSCRESGWINGGVYLLAPRIKTYFPPLRIFSFEKDVMEKRVHDLSINPYMEDAFFIDIGIPEDLEKARAASRHLRSASCEL